MPPELIAFDKKLASIERNGAGVELTFTDGGRAVADALIGADGVHSTVREILLGPEKPKFTGRVAHRTTFPSALMGGFELDTCTKWWGPDRHIVDLSRASRARGDLLRHQRAGPRAADVESWSARGEMSEVIAAFAGFHDDVQRVLAACPQIHKWALFERDPLPDLGRRADRAPGRCLPPDDALYGAGGGQRLGGRGGACALHRRGG